MSVWFITGASRGFGRELTASALAHGDHVATTARDPHAVRDAFPDSSRLTDAGSTRRHRPRPGARGHTTGRGALRPDRRPCEQRRLQALRGRRGDLGRRGPGTVGHECVRSARRRASGPADAARPGCGGILNIGRPRACPGYRGGRLPRRLGLRRVVGRVGFAFLAARGNRTTESPRSFMERSAFGRPRLGALKIPRIRSRR